MPGTKILREMHGRNGLRSNMMRTARLAAALLMTVLAIGFPALADIGQEEIELPLIDEVECESYIVYNRTKDEIVIEKNADGKIYPASMTKIMTAALTLDTLQTDQILTASNAAINAITPNSTKMKLVIGEQTTVSELLFGLMLPSGNDAANVLGEAIVDATAYSDAANPDRSKLGLFSDLMNQKAAELGLTSTHFVNANGLHDPNHYTTAAELAKIFDYALEKPDFRTVISAPTHVFKATNIKEHNFDAWSIVKNTNCLLTDPWILGADAKVAQIVGGKTGTTVDGGTGMTVLAVDQNGDELITVVCGIPYVDANRQTAYVAAVLKEGARICFESDPVVRVAGNVLDNQPTNAPASMKPTGETGITTDPSTPEETAMTEPSAAETTTAESSAAPLATPEPTPSPATDDFVLFRFVREQPVLSIIIGAVLLIVIVLVAVYLIANRSRRRPKNSGIRRI